MHTATPWVLGCTLLAALGSCTSPTTEATTAPSVSTDLAYATTFTLSATDSGTQVTILSPWMGSEEAHHYFLYPRTGPAPQLPAGTQGVAVPIRELVCYGTTQLPYLAQLGAEEALVAFPGTQYITTPSVVAQVQAGAVRDLGSASTINTEVLLEVAPELVMMFALNAPGDEYDQLRRAGTPVLFNADYLEAHPLGRAEYVKLFGALLGQQARADSVFRAVEAAFQAQAARVDSSHAPTVMAGLVYGDVWFAPGGESWLADFIRRAGGHYVYADRPGAGSLQLSFERVYADCLEADYWIGVGSFTERSAMAATEPRFADFSAYQQGQVFSYMKGARPEGGVPYFEQGYARPDLVLSDFIYMLQPHTPADSLHFFVPVL